MDPIAGLLDGPRARRAFLLRCTLDPPWALHIRDEAPLSLVAMLRGRACFVLDGREPEWLDRGDVAILLGPDHYLFADDPATPPQAVIHPGQRCTTPDGRELYYSSGVAPYYMETIFFSRRLPNGRWGPPRLAPFSGRNHDFDPNFSPDGRRMVFISDRPTRPGEVKRECGET